MTDFPPVAEAPPQPVRGWAAIDTEDFGTVVLLVVDLPEQVLDGEPETDHFLSDAYGGAWFGARSNDEPALAFSLVEVGSPESSPTTWYLLHPPADAVVTVVGAPHFVAVIPSDAPGIEAFGHDMEASVALIVHAVVVRATQHQGSLLTLRSESLDDQAACRDGLIDLEDPEALQTAVAPVRSRVARATGEFVADNQLIPMAWRPWHYGLIDQEHIGGLLWQWPVIQTYFGLGDPAETLMTGIGSPTPERRRGLLNYLRVVDRLARSIAVNSGGSIKTSWTRENDEESVEVDAPHADALAALLPSLRQLFDPNEGSGLSFTHLLNALSSAAYRAGLVDLVDELKIWKKAHQRLRRSHLNALRQELAEELAGESMGPTTRGPMPGGPEITSEDLILTFMYGETLHRDDDAGDQIAEWDQDSFWGPFMRQEVRADAQGFVHFYGAFAGHVARWLEVADDGASNARARGRES